jgi:hypothetical protein
MRQALFPAKIWREGFRVQRFNSELHYDILTVLECGLDRFAGASLDLRVLGSRSNDIEILVGKMC